MSISRTSDMEDEAIHGRLTATVEAADLSGGTPTGTLDGANSQAIDLDDFLDSHEQFVVNAVEFAGHLHMPTTATAEGSAVVHCRVGEQEDISSFGSTFYSGNTDATETGSQLTWKIRRGAQEETGFWRAYYFTAGSSVADSTNGLGAGAMDSYVYDLTTFDDLGIEKPVLDDDDEIHIPSVWGIDNVSDHAVNWEAEVGLYGGLRHD